MLQYESLQRYYTFVGERLARRRRQLAQAVLMSSSGAALALVAELPLVVGQTLALLCAGLAIWLEAADYSDKSVRSLGVATDLSHLAAEMRTLWMRLDELEDAEIGRTWRDLDGRAAEVTRHVPCELLTYYALQDRAEDGTYGYWAAAQGSGVAGA